MKNTIVVSLYGGPGTGKSTGAAYIFSQLKIAGFNAELATEYAKTRVWQKDFQTLSNQVYVAGKQYQNLLRLKGQVDIIVTDSPIILSALYLKDKSYAQPFKEVLKCLHNEFDNLDVFLTRVKRYEEAGRYQKEDEARSMDKITMDLLKEFGIDFVIEEGSTEGYNKIFSKIATLYERLLRSET